MVDQSVELNCGDLFDLRIVALAGSGYPFACIRPAAPRRSHAHVGGSWCFVVGATGVLNRLVKKVYQASLDAKALWEL